MLIASDIRSDAEISPLNILVDTIALSRQRCPRPIVGDLVYATAENFVGRVIDGYSADISDVCLLTKSAAIDLCNVQNYLLQNHDLGLLVYDAYRPHRAVKDFARWFKAPASEKEIARKKIHYPHVEKSELEELGYVAGDTSRHNFGFAVDLVLFDLNKEEALPMGACFDYFDELSHANVRWDVIGMEAYNNRKILTDAMLAHNFLSYEYEFWHFDHTSREVQEPIDIPITKELRNLNVDV